MLAHVGFEADDLQRSAAFYDAVFTPLGYRRLRDGEALVAWGVTAPRFFLTARSAPRPGYGHVAVTAAGRAAVDAAHAAGLRAGGTDAGAPGPRPQYGRAYYAAYLLDPDGLQLELVANHD